MKVVIFDTETTSLNKPFCYNIGYVILDTETNMVINKKEYVVEQVWHNPMLFSTAYYAEKRPLYINRMRAKQVDLDKFGYICQKMIRDFRNFQVERAFAYNSDFDERVFQFNCDWFKCNNPFDNIPIADIRGFVHNFLITDDFKQFCEENEQFTEGGNYSTTAETMFRYISENYQFEEEHTALNDSEIESQLLIACLECGADINENYPILRSIPREISKILTIDNHGIKIELECKGYTVYKSKDLIKLK